MTWSGLYQHCHVVLWKTSMAWTGWAFGDRDLWRSVGEPLNWRYHGRWVPPIPCRVLCHPTGSHQFQTGSKTHAPAVCVCATCARKLWKGNNPRPPNKNPASCTRFLVLPPPAQVRDRDNWFSYTLTS